MTYLLRTFIVGVAVVALASQAQAQLSYTGVNLSGAEFNSGDLPGDYGYDYIYPGAASIDYFVDKGMNTFRLPFRWERLQRELGGELHSDEMQRINNVVEHATNAGAHVVLDPHNYARYNGTVIGTGDVSNADFADLWSRLAEKYKDNDNVIFNLVNEPHGVDGEDWVISANTAIQAIRDTGAENLILVPGVGYTGAHSWNSTWYGTPNAETMLDIVDPGDNYAFDVHQYLDDDSSGTSDEITSINAGANRLNTFTQWAKEHGVRGFLGEFAVANSTIGDDPDQIGDEALTELFSHMQENDDVWMGWTWWAAGPWWGDYMFNLQPRNLGQPDQEDRAAMAELDSWVIPEPTSASLLLGGLTALALRRRRARSARAHG